MLEQSNLTNRRSRPDGHRRDFIGGSDARVIMGQDEKALIRLWQEKRGEVGREDLSGNLIVQRCLATEDLNRTSYPRNNGRAISAPAGSIKYLPGLISDLAGAVAGAIVNPADGLAAGRI